ncbi:hypothetical protein ACA910_020569 [Epithemia clementina (nom. ined.)]
MLPSIIVVLLCNLAAIRLSSKIDQLRVAEHRLMEYAKDFAPNRSPISSSSSSSSHNDDSFCEIRTIDTKIPQSTVPLKHHIDDLYRDTCMSSNDHAQTYVIHGVEVKAKDKGASAAQVGSRSQVPLVLLHGYMNGCLYYYRNLYGLSRYFDSIYSLDLLGWGLSSRPRFAALRDSSREVTEAFFVDSLEAWRKAQRVDKMILAGHSMGGYISVAYAEKYPQHVERLILISPAGVPEQPQQEKQQQQQQLRIEKTTFLERRASEQIIGDFSSALHNLIRQITKDVYTHVFHNYSLGDLLRSVPSIYGMHRIRSYIKHRFTSDCAKMSPKEQDALSNYLYWNNALPGSGEYCISRFLTPMVVFGQAPTIHRIPNLQVKSVAFLYGDQDWMDPVQGGWAVQRACLQKQKALGSKLAAPEVSVHTISEAGHLLMLEHWQDFNRQLVLAAGLKLLPEDLAQIHTLSPASAPSAVSPFHGNNNARIIPQRQFGTATCIGAHASPSSSSRSLSSSAGGRKKVALPNTIEHIHRIQMAI